jgi:apolipoprotein N-acyltransferase
MPAFALAFCSSALIALAVRYPSLGWLAWVAYVPVLIAIRQTSTKRYSTLWMSIALIGGPMIGYEGALLRFPLAFPIIIVVYLVIFGLAGFTLKFLHQQLKDTAFVWFAPVYVACELLLTHEFIFGQWTFPIGLIGYSQSQTPLLAFASIGGVSFISLLIIFFNTSVFYIAISKTPKRWVWVLPPLLTLGIATTSPYWYAPNTQTTGEIVFVQPAKRESDYKIAEYDQNQFNIILEHYLKLAKAAITPKTRLVIFPENSITRNLTTGGFVPNRNDLYVASRLKTLNVERIWFGALHKTPTGRYNAMLEYRKNQTGFTLLYQKHKLFPIAEDWAKSGKQFGGIAEFDGNKVGIAICLETLYPQAILNTIRAGAQLLIFPTNTRWADHTATGEMHFITSIFRAVETHRSVLHIGQFGPSGYIAPNGQINSRILLGNSSQMVILPAVSMTSTPFSQYSEIITSFLAFSGWLVPIFAFLWKSKRRELFIGNGSIAFGGKPRNSVDNRGNS